MKYIKLLGIDLRLFDGGAAGASGTAGAAGIATGDTGTTQAENKTVGSSRQQRKSGELSNVVYGKQETAEPATTETTPAAEVKKETEVTTTSNTLEDKRKAFEDLINGEYKDMFTERTQNIIDRRFKETKNLEAYKQATDPVIETLMSKYKIADGDVNKLAKAIEQDDTYWEEAAEEAGLTVEQYKTVQKLERENAEFKRMQQMQANQQKAEQQIAQWVQQGEEAKKTYPDFDFKTEARDPEFMKMLKAGIPVQTAYEVKHMNTLLTGAARVAAQQAEQQTVARIKDKASRPAENGMSSQSASIIKSDVSSLTKADRAEIARRAARGERISF